MKTVDFWLVFFFILFRRRFFLLLLKRHIFFTFPSSYLDKLLNFTCGCFQTETSECVLGHEKETTLCQTSQRNALPGWRKILFGSKNTAIFRYFGRITFLFFNNERKNNRREKCVVVFLKQNLASERPFLRV